MTASIRDLSVNLDLPQCDLPDNILTKAINFTSINGKLVTTKMSVQAPVNTSGWLPLPGSGIISLSQIFHLSFDAASFDDTATAPDILNKWDISLWGTDAPEYVPVVTGSADLAVTHNVFIIQPTFQYAQPISLLVTLKTTVANNMLMEDTSAAAVITIDSSNRIVFLTTVTTGVVAIDTYFTLLFQLDSLGVTRLYLKEGDYYTYLGMASLVLDHNLEFNSPWGRADRRTVYVSDIAGYKGHII